MRFVLHRLLLAAVPLLFAAPALAVPVTYGLTAGTITVQANRQVDNALIYNQTIDLSTNSFITWDAAGVPAAGFGGTLDDFLMEIVVPFGPSFLETDPGTGQPYLYGPFDMITVETGVISPDTVAGYQTNFTFPSGSNFIFDAGSIDVLAEYSAEHSTTGANTGGTVPADITGVNPMNGTVNFNGTQVQVILDSIVMGTLDGTPFGEAGNDLTITSNINFFGDSNVVPTPEPGTGAMLALGLAALGLRRQRETRS